MAKILLVEDNTHNQNLFLTTLRHHGHLVSLAEDGEQALKLFSEQSFDLILLDLSIPKIDGWTVAQRIRSSEEQQDNGHAITIIALTAHAMRGDKERALKAGCNDYLSKPVSPRELARRVKSLVGVPSAA